MSPCNCAVVGCYNSRKKLRKWKESKFEIHGVLIKDCVCIYNPPYRLLEIFLWKGEKIEKLIEQLRQENKNKSTCKPCDSNCWTNCYTLISKNKTWLWEIDTATRNNDCQAPSSSKEMKKWFKHHLSLEPYHAKDKSSILNFHWNTSIAICQVMKNVVVAFKRKYQKNTKISEKKWSIW